MTTQNHTALAAIAAIPTDSSSFTIKVMVIFALVVSHVMTDALPHLHFYEFKKLPKYWFGAIIELGGGLVVLPFLILYFTDINPWYLITCVLASNSFDFLVAVKIGFITKINHLTHWWTKFVSQYFNPVTFSFELIETIILFGILFRLLTSS